MIVVVGGPTASGKSSLALELAEQHRGEIVCGDSRQVYAGMQVGAAGPTAEERARVPHHRYAVIDPEDRYDAARFLEDTDQAVADIEARGMLAIVVGGAGLYLRAWRFGLDDVPARDDAVRLRLEAELETTGLAAMHARLAAADPETGQRVDPADPVRVVRSLEILELTGELPSALRATHFKGPARQTAAWHLLCPERAWLTERIKARAAAMVGEALIAESLKLRERLGPGHPLLDTMGYREALALHDGELSRTEAIAETAKRHRGYAKRQMTWFKRETWWTAHEIPPNPGIEALRPDH